jgi:hypothetical protein
MDHTVRTWILMKPTRILIRSKNATNLSEPYLVHWDVVVEVKAYVFVK